MKATRWLCPAFILLCATKLVYTAQRGTYGGYALNDMDSQLLQNDNFRLKRNKPSLSIVNPLDVLRQRLLLEIARRQMKENSRQVELNRAILKNVGKRMASKYSSPLIAAPYDANESQQQQQQQRRQQRQQVEQEEFMQHLPTTYEYDLIPTTVIFDYLQKQQQQQQQKKPSQYSWMPYGGGSALRYDSSYINDAIDDKDSNGQVSDSNENEVQDEEIMAFYNLLGVGGLNGSGGGNQRSLKRLTQTNNEYSTLPNEQKQEKDENKTIQKSINSRDDDTKHLKMINNHQTQHQNSLNSGSSNNFNLAPNEGNQISYSNTNANEFKNQRNINGGDYQLQRYLYHLHKNHLARK